MEVQVIKCEDNNLWYSKMNLPFTTEIKLAKTVVNKDDLISEFWKNNNIHDYYYSENLKGYIKMSDCIQEKSTKNFEGKLFYEIDWSFIKGMAERMSLNKNNGQYSLFGWLENGVDIKQMNQAIIRHLVAIMEGELDDEGQKYGHYYALACNSMLILNTLKQNER